MEQLLLENESVIRVSFFVAGYLSFLAFGLYWPSRQDTRASRGKRWVTNTSLTIFNSALVRLCFPLTLVGLARFAGSSGGLLDLVDMPFWLKTAVAVVIFDFVIYWQHRIFHLFGPFWRLHRVHHADIDFDVTTALRFHPLEIVASVVFKAATILVIGAPIVSVVIFEVLLNLCAMFNHSNWHLPGRADRWLRKVIVTPDMHRVHHSVYPDEINKNFGFCLSIWDRLFGTYAFAPKEGHTAMQIGLNQFRSSRDQSFWRLIVQPFK